MEQALAAMDMEAFTHPVPACSLSQRRPSGKPAAPHTGTAVVAFTRSSTKLVLQSCTLGCLSSVSMMKRL